MAIDANELDIDTIVDIAKKWASGMSPQQCDMYVIHSQVTKDRQVKQCLMEIENRNHNLQKLDIEKRKHEVNLRKVTALYEAEEDPDEKELFQIELDSMALDFDVFKRRKITQEKEIQSFFQWLLDEGYTAEELEKRLEYDPEEERKYWISRMGKQAALDVVFQGRIGTGNLDSIAMMKETDQQAILEIAMQYSALYNVSMKKIQERLLPYIQQMEESSTGALPTFHGIDDNLEIGLLSELKTIKGELNAAKPSTPSLQLTYKPKAS
tara:strand:- start:4427 stop:5227 length:801 start_codon:yes stop_codon:yes gene_type:complete